jgi:uncharacterized Zn finger protein
MSWEYFSKSPKRPPPEHGIKVGKLGTTWWGQRWISSLEHFSRDYLSRLGRGRTYARTGRVHDLKISAGKVTARVTGSEPTPYEVSLTMDAFSAREWQVAIGAMAQEARFAADLLAGQMPQDIDTVFRKSKRSLFPRKSHDLETDCSCPDWANPCKHVAAMHYVLGEAFDRDPFLLFELRGRSREQVLAALSGLRSGEPSDVLQEERGEEVPISSVTVTAAALENYEQSPAPLAGMNFSFDPPLSPAAILRSVAPPRSWSLEEAPAEFFAAPYQRAADAARQMALASPEEVQGAQSAAPVAKTPRKRTLRRK